MFEEVMQKLQKIIKNGVPKGVKNNQKPIKNRFDKKVGKRWSDLLRPGRPSALVRLL